jgi:hypothetical protein
MSAGSSENPVVKTRGPSSPRTGDHLSGGCHARWPFFLVPVVLMASGALGAAAARSGSPYRLNRWFLTVAGSLDAIAAGVLLVLAQRLRRTLLICGLDDLMSKT